jgi:pimeloyl-ACP methyl ester carboxylesterase
MPAVLLIRGATGDGGRFDTLARRLAGEFTIVVYDRPSGGGGHFPAGWQTTSPEEEADEAANLLEKAEAGPAVVFGTGSDANLALCLLIRHPGRVRGAVLHDPALYGLFDDPGAVRASLRELVHGATEPGGPPAGMERFWRYATGDDAWTKLLPGLRERLQASCGTLFGVELGSRYLPDDDLATRAPPVLLLVSHERLPFFAEMAGRLSERLRVEVTIKATDHTAYHGPPGELAEAVRPFLREAGAPCLASAAAA